MSEEKPKMTMEEFHEKMKEKRRIASLCPVCACGNVQKYKEVREDIQEVEYHCYCPDCGSDCDIFNINSGIYDWSQLPQRRSFEEFSDYRDEGGKVEKYRIDYDAKWDDPKRVIKLWESK